MIRAEAVVAVRNAQLDGATLKFGANVLAESGGDRKSAFFRRFFSVAPSQFVRQPLRKQCETTLNVVIAELDKLDPKHTLRAFASPLSSMAKAALKALDARNKAKGERTTGSNDVDEWKEGVNALRLTTYAELLKIAADKGYGWKSKAGMLVLCGAVWVVLQRWGVMGWARSVGKYPSPSPCIGRRRGVSFSAMSEDEEDAPATRIANYFMECFEVAAAFASTAGWRRYCETTAAGERKQRMLQVLSDFINSRSLLELPTVHGPKPMVRRAMAIAAELQQLVVAWDDNIEPSAAMATMAHRFMDCMRDPEGHLDLP